MSENVKCNEMHCICCKHSKKEPDELPCLRCRWNSEDFFEPEGKVTTPTCLTDQERREELLERYKE